MGKQLMIIGITLVLLAVGLNGCIEQTTVETENKSPIAICNANITSGEAPLTVSFTGSGLDYDGNIVSYHWDFDDGETSTEQNPTHTFQTYGTYNVLLKITDDERATATKTVTINVEESEYDE